MGKNAEDNVHTGKAMVHTLKAGGTAMRISLQNWERACKLHKEMAVADLHLDLPGELLFRHQHGEREVLKKHYLPLWQRSGIYLIGASVYVEDAALPEGGLRNALLQIAALMEEIEELRGEVALIRNGADLLAAKERRRIGIFLYLEGLDVIGLDLSLLSLFRRLGVCGASLTWSRPNLLACGCCRAGEENPKYGGITEAGLRVLAEMKRLNMFLDLSHLNDEGIELILKQQASGTGSSLPFVLATHADAREVYFHYRNLTEEQIEKIAEAGGIIGVNACTLLTGSVKDGKHLEWLLRHIRYLLKHAGGRGVGLGLDLCSRYEQARLECEGCGQGNDAFLSQEESLLLTAALLEDGIPERQVQGVLGENAFTFLEKIF